MPGRVRPGLLGLAMTASLAVMGSTLVVMESPARASTAPPAASRSVPYKDLNLASAEGVAELEARIARSAERLCAQRGAPTAAGHLASRRCFKSAVVQAKPAIREAAVRQKAERMAALASLGGR